MTITHALVVALSLPSFALAAPKDAKEPLAKVNGVAITKDAVSERASRQFGAAVLEDMVVEQLVAQEAAAMKLTPDAAEVEARLKRIRDQFKDEAVFEARLKAVGTSRALLLREISDSVLREELVKRAKSLAVTDAEAKEFFEANKERLGVPEAVRVRHILVATQKEAADFTVALKAGADFASLARQVSLDAPTKERGGDLGFVSRAIFSPEIEAAVFSLKPGEMSQPVKTPQGYHLLKVEETRAAKAAVYSEVAEDLKRAILVEKINKAWPGYLAELRAKAKIELGKP